MCGIFGWVALKKVGESEENNQSVLRYLVEKSTRRGKDGCGIFFEGMVLKDSIDGRELVKTKGFKEIERAANVSQMLIGQTRLTTNGDDRIENIQPIVEEGLVLVHNGIVVNDQALAREYQIKCEGLSDSVIIARILRKLIEKYGVQKSLEIVSQKILGTYNLVISFQDKVFLVSNNGSLYWLKVKKRVYFASEKNTLETMANKYQINGKIIKVAPLTGLKIMAASGRISKIDLKKSNVGEYVYQNKYEVERRVKKHKIDWKQIDKIKRCTKCILPETTPQISFNGDGICNFCTNYEKMEVRGEAELEKLVEKYRSDDGSTDCIIAFSGGRDSSAGIDYLVNKLKMHPVAVTFDWGMLSDIGRKNQALMLGKLGVEQIVVAARMKSARADIKTNLEAWLDQPELGMIPILMQGDKTTEYYVDKIKKELGVKLVFFCRGNSLEREEFKAGYCGVKNADPGGVIHNYSWLDKVRLLRYYLVKFWENPKYINRTLWSSMKGYLVTFVVPHDYIYLWHYIKWDEKKIIDRLEKEYQWIADDETGITWRVDDGSPAFYDYVYCQMQGFTENDSFRSNQIREGILKREEAIRMVRKENMPRYKVISWYFDAIGVDGDRVLSIIDKAKREYKSAKIDS